ncbi:MAG: hypothetical protein QW035_02230 [Candidatus Anstonellales archaeon]
MPVSAQEKISNNDWKKMIEIRLEAIDKYNRRNPRNEYLNLSRRKMEKIDKFIDEFLIKNLNNPNFTKKQLVEHIVEKMEEIVYGRRKAGKEPQPKGEEKVKKGEEVPKKVEPKPEERREKEDKTKKEDKKKEEPSELETQYFNPKELTESQKSMVLKYFIQSLALLGRVGDVDTQGRLVAEKLYSEMSKDPQVKKYVNKLLIEAIKEGKWPSQLEGAARLKDFVRRNREKLAKVIGEEEDVVQKVMQLNEGYANLSSAMAADASTFDAAQSVANLRQLLKEIEKKNGREGVNYLIEKKYGPKESLKKWFGVDGKDAYEVLLKALQKIENDKGFQGWRGGFAAQYGTFTKENKEKQLEHVSLLKNLDLLQQYSFYSNLVPVIRESNYVGVMGKWNEEKKGYEYVLDSKMDEVEWLRLFAEHFGAVKLDSTKLELINSFYPHLLGQIEDLGVFIDVLNAVTVAESKIISYYTWEAESKVVEHFERKKEVVSFSLQEMMKILINEMYQDRGLSTAASTIYGYGSNAQIRDESMRLLGPTEQWVRNFYISQRGYPSAFSLYPGANALFPMLTRGEQAVEELRGPYERPNFGMPFDAETRSILSTKRYVPVLPFKILSSSLSKFIVEMERPKFFDKTKFLETTGVLSGRYYDRGERDVGYGTITASFIGIGRLDTTITTDFHRYRLDSILNDISNGENWTFDGRVSAVVGEEEEELHTALDLMVKEGLLKGNTLLFFDKTEKGYSVRGYFHDTETGYWYRVHFDAPKEGLDRLLIAMSGNSAEMKIMASEDRLVGGLLSMSTNNFAAFAAAADNASAVGLLMSEGNKYGYVEVYGPPVIKGGEKSLDYGLMAGYFVGRDRKKDFMWLGIAGESKEENNYYVASYGMKEGNISVDASIFNLRRYSGKGTGVGGTFGGHLSEEEWDGLILGTFAKETLLGMDSIILQGTYGKGNNTKQTVQLSYYNYAQEFSFALLELAYINVNIREELKRYQEKLDEINSTEGDKGKLHAELGRIKSNIERYLKRGRSALSLFALSQTYYGALYAVNKKGLGKLELAALYGKEGNYGVNAFIKIDGGVAASMGLFEYTQAEKMTEVQEAQVVVPISSAVLGVVVKKIKESGSEGVISTDSLYAGIKSGNITLVMGYTEGNMAQSITPEKIAEYFKDAKITLGEVGIEVRTKNGLKWYVGFTKQGMVLIDANAQAKDVTDELLTFHGGIYSLRVNNEGKLALTDIRFYLGGGKTNFEGGPIKELVMGVAVDMKKGSDSSGVLDIKFEKVGQSWAIGIGGYWYWIF